MSALAVVILNYNGDGEIIGCLRSVLEQQPAQVVVVDNASTDGSDLLIEALFPQIRVVRNAKNTGFAAAANQAIRETTTERVLLLNPDATLEAGALDALDRSLDDHPRAGAVGAMVRNPDGTEQPTKRRFPSIGQAALHGLVGMFRKDNPGTRAYLLADERFDRPRTIDWVSGTAMALRRDAFENIGGFDESFFFFVEDIDFCKRLWEADWEVWFEPGAEVVHRWGMSWTQRPVKFLWLHQRNLFRYVRKHQRGAWVLAYPVIAAGLFARFVLLAIRWVITRRSVPSHRSVGGRP